MRFYVSSGLNCVENSMGVGSDLVCGGVADGGEVRLVFGMGLARRCL